MTIKALPLEKFPSGKYFIGDPCYVIDHRDKSLDGVWNAFCDADDWDGSPFDIKGIIMGSASTMYGDGSYEDYSGNRYRVDSGTIGAASVDHLSEEKISNLQKFGQIVEFDNDFNIEKCGSQISIGQIIIETVNEEEYYEEYDEECDW